MLEKECMEAGKVMEEKEIQMEGDTGNGRERTVGGRMCEKDQSGHQWSVQRGQGGCVCVCVKGGEEWTGREREETKRVTERERDK